MTTLLTVGSSSSSSSNHHLHLESLPLVDLRLLSQSELNSFSLCSSQSYHLLSSDNDFVIPKIDRSLFNESAGSRKQTYSRLRLAPRKPPQATTGTIGRGRPCASLAVATAVPVNPIDDPERKENHLIVSHLRNMLGMGNSVNSVDLAPAITEENAGEAASVMETRKRCREVFWNGNGKNGKIVGVGSMEIVNKNGVVVDIAGLAGVEDPYGLELRRRTAGLETEEGLLGFLRGLEGQWGSRRKRRKIVAADLFGDALPVGWNILLSLKRKEGRVWLYCRRYISPNGRQFLSCKEVSSYLLSVFGPQDKSDPSDGNHGGAYKLASASEIAGLSVENDDKREEPIYHPPSAVASLSTEHEKEVDVMGTENLADVEIKDLLECHVCNMNFSEKDAYLQHLFSSHQRSAKRCRLGSSVGDGVIIKDGKYECQFCHKVFLERHRYNGHVGVHVRNYVRSLEASQGGAAAQNIVDLSSLKGVELSEINASINPEDDFVALTSAGNSSDKMIVGSPKDELDMNSIPESSAKFSMHGEQDNRDSLSKNETGGSVPQTSAETKDEPSGVPSGVSKLNASGDIDNNSVLQAPNVKPNDKTDVDFRNGEVDTNSIPETSTTKSNNELSVGSEDNKRDSANSISVTSAESKDDFDTVSVGVFNVDASVDVKNVSLAWSTIDKLNDKMDISSPTNSIPEISTAKFDSELQVDTGDCVLQSSAMSQNELNLGLQSNECRDTHEKDETFMDESHEKEDQGYETSDTKLARIDEFTSSVQREIDSCLDSVTAALSKNEEDAAIAAYDGKGILTNSINEIGMSSLEKVSGSNGYSLTSSGNEQFSGVESSVDGTFSMSERNFEVVKAKASESNKPESDAGTNQAACYKEFLTKNLGVLDEENILLQSMVSDMPSPLMQSSDCFPALNLISDKEQGANNFCNVNQKHENESGFGELRLDEIEPASFGLGITGEGSSSLPEGPVDLAYNADLEQGLAGTSAVQFEWDTILPKTDTSHQVTTVCIWCRTPFNHDNINLLEKQSDSLGFICPDCKAKISGQLNIFDNGLSMNLDHL